MKRIGVMVNAENPRSGDALTRLAGCASQLGLVLTAWGESAALMTKLGLAHRSGGPAETEALLVLGGDGTMLRAARDTVSAGRPVMGVNIGSLGFLTSVAESDLERAAACLARNDYTESRRALAAVEVWRAGVSLMRTLCLNDLVLRNGDSARIVAMEIAVDDGAPTPITGDGLIIATPTGSTGHSLSAGGPILHPACPAFVVTFICAHALGARPLVIPDASAIEVALVRCAGEVRLIVDGQAAMSLEPGDRVRAARAAETVTFIHPPGYDFLTLLHQKLHWKGSSV